MNRPLPSPPEPPQCQAAFTRMPWLVNGTLSLLEARELEAHAAGCALCHGRLSVERALFAAIRRPSDNVHQSPLAAWARFEAAVGGVSTPGSDATSTPSGTPCGLPTGRTRTVAPAATRANALPPAGRRHPLRLAVTLQAAAIAALSLALLWMLAARSPGEPPATYRTVAAPAATVGSGTAWRVALDPTTTPADAAPLLASQGLRVLAGPSRTGVYTVAPLPGATPRIDALRADPRVRLIEPLDDAVTTGAPPNGNKR